MKYYIWTIGCQMNRSESSELGNLLDILGIEPVKIASEADIVILNTCVVRQNAEDKVVGMLGYLRGIKKERPEIKIVVTGCFVGSEIALLVRKYPYVDLFFQPGKKNDFEDWLYRESIYKHNVTVSAKQNITSPISASIPIIQGCNNFCSYCIVPYRRGRECSRSSDEILTCAKKLIDRGARELILLGQNVNAYGKDLNPSTNLAELLQQLNAITGLARIRFLTNHPKDMGSGLIQAMLSLDKVCHQLCLPLQSGDDQILRMMNRQYTASDYVTLIDHIRSQIPDIAISTDIIVGFPGESERQYLNTRKIVSDLLFDVVHVAAYSPRAGTSASKNLIDDIPHEEKMRRLHDLEHLQSTILYKINSNLLGKTAEVLVEGKKGHKWFGRTYSDKLVFFENDFDCKGRLMNIKISQVSPWALQGIPCEKA